VMIQGKMGIGKYLFELRLQNRLSLAKVSIHVGINPMALSEIERGVRIPNDKLLRNIANFFNVDENILFNLVGKVPLGAKEELEQSPVLQKTLLEIKKVKHVQETKGRALY